MKPNERGMTLPISSYEKLLDQVRELTHETRLLQRDLHSALYNANIPPDVNHNFTYERRDCKKGRILADNIIRKDEKKRRTEDGQGPFVECNNLRLRPRFLSNLESVDYFRSSDLTSRLLAQRSYEHDRLISQEEAEVVGSKKTWGLFPKENTERGVGIGGAVRVGERGGRGGGLVGEAHHSYERFEVEECVGSSSGLGTSSSSSSSSSNNLAQINNSNNGGSGIGSGSSCSSSRNIRYNNPQNVRRPIRILERDSSTALSSCYPVVVAAHEPETASCSSRRPAALAVPAVPVVAAPTTIITTKTVNTAATAATTAAAAVRSAAAKNLLMLDAANTDLRQSNYLLSSSAGFVKDTKKEDAMEPEIKEEDERRSSTSSPEFYVRRNKCYNEDASSEEENKPGTSSLQCHGLPSSYSSGTWPIRRDLWANQQMGFSNQQSTSSTSTHNDMASVMSFSSNSGTMLGSSTEMQGHRRLGAKVDVVYNLLSMLGSSEGREDMSTTLLSMSTSIDSCLVMRQSGCLPLLVQLIHAPGQDPETREKASRALHNVVHAKSDERAGRREARVLKFLEQLRDYCQSLRTLLESGEPADLDKHPGQTIAALMKVSFDEAHRHAMCQLGGLHAVAELIEMDHMAHGSECDDQNCITLRRYAGMALTNLTFGDGNNKALLCSFREFMKALVSQLRSPSDDLRQVTASVLRNLSWRADSSSKQTLREVGAVTGLMKAAMEGRKESTLKSILSALWNLSAHCSTNKVDICAVDGALAFLVDMLSYNAPSKTLAIVENAGGILRNVSCHVAVREDYRAIVRERGCLQVLLQQLRSPSLTVVSNACGALWNLSARCPQDQRLLWSLGAVPMLRSLVHSKHKMISMGSSAALKNLLSAKPGCSNLVQLDSTARGLGLSTLPSLAARRQRALEQEIDQNLAETCDNIEPSTSPTNKDDKFSFKVDHSFLAVNTRGLRSYQLYNQSSTSSSKCNGVSRSESRESMRSVTSTHSDTMFERVHRHVMNGMSPTEVQGKQSLSLHAATGFDNGIQLDIPKTTSSEKKYTMRYKNAISDNLRPTDIGFGNGSELRSTTSTISWSSVPDQEAVCSQTLLHSSVEDNASLLNQSMSSTSKFTNQSSVSEDTEVTVCQNSEYRSDISKSKSGISSQLSYVPDNFSTKQCEDYDRMYTDASLLHQHDPLNSIQNAISPTLSHNSEESLFRNYAETDLDQPTDYSIRYAEQTVEDDEKQHAVYFVTTEQGLITSSLPNEVSCQEDDTIKMYCTEGTPRGISLNSSRAASSSDLQEDTKMKSLSRRLLEPNKLHDIEQNDKASSLLDIEKVNRFTNGQDKKQDFNSTKEFAEKTTWQESSSSVSSNCQYNQDKSTKINTSDVKMDKHEITTNQSIAFNSEFKVSKELFLNKGTSFVGNLDQASDVDEDDEDLLAACINIGMQNNRHRHSFIGNSLEKLPRAESNLMRYQTSVALDQVESNDSIGSATDSFNLIQPETTGKALPINNLREHSSSVLLNIIQSSKNDDSLTTKEDQTKSKEQMMLSQNMQKDSSNGNVSVTSMTDHNNFSVHTASSTIDVTLSSSKKTIISNINYSVQDKSETSLKEYRETSNNACINKDLVVPKKDELLTDTEVVENVNETRMKSTDSESSNSIDSVEQSEHALLELCIQTGLPNAAENITGKHSSIVKQQNKLLNDESYMHLKNSLKDESSSIESTKDNIDGKETKCIVDKTTKRVEEDVYRRQRDPDAMIASLDRLTATLVQQTEAIRERDSSNTMKQSILSDTWNEDSPNEMSFPSISISAPMIPSFKSDVPDGQTIMSDIVEGEDDEHVSMTDSKIIQQEAIKLAEAVDAEVNKQNEMETTSMTSIDLDAIKPPSTMGSLLSLTASYAGPTDNTESYVNRDRCYSTSLPPVQTKSQSSTDTPNCRKKSLPLGVVAKRALNQGQSHSGSLENLLNDCIHSHLENVKPPSVMDELLDVGDMENSMLSVASITSEIADNKDHDSHSLSESDPVFDLLKPVANVLSITCMRYAEGMQSSGNNSLSEYLENINPPSLFNEVSEMDQSTMEGNTDTLCNDTLCIDTELRTEEVPPTLVEAIDEGENDTDEGITTISSEYGLSSSAESTPKKRSSKNHLTPKQKRNLAKERYKTYTIAAEFVKKEEERRKQEGKPGETPNKITQGKCSPFSKLTPKQRRQEDRARFQTQVLENPFPNINALVYDKEEIEQSCQQKDTEVGDPSSASKSSIPTLTKLPIPKALRKKRADNQENKERYRTRTLNDSECLQKPDDCDLEVTVNVLEKESTDNVHNIALEEINNMLEHNATIVLNTLNESSKNHAISLGDDVLLDQETLSLVSNESGSEQSLRLCFVNGVSKKLMDTYTHQAQDISQRFNHNVQEEKDKSDVEHVQEENDPVESGSDNGSNCTEEQCQVMKRPRIIKPGMGSSRDVSADSNNTDKSEPGSPKAIRGRRKALYSNPITRKPTPQSSPLKHPTPISAIPIGRSNTSPIVRTTRATTLRQSNGLGVTAGTKEPLKINTSPKISSAIANYENKIKNMNAASKRTSVPTKGSSLTFTRPNKRHSTPACSSSSQNECKAEVLPIKPLERQGTFTKDEPEVENAPTVFSPASPIKTKIAKPIKGTSKIHPAVGKSKISVRAHQTYQTKGVKANGIEKPQVSKVMPTLGIPKSSGKVTGTGKGLSSNQNTLQNDSGKVYRKVGPLGQRSNSNSSIISDTSNGVQGRRLAKEATSKIASLWKKVEESKTKQISDKSDARKWITPVGGGTADAIDGQIISSKPPAFRLFRSSTFEGVPKDDSHKLSIQKTRSKQPSITNVQTNGIKYRNSCDLSGMNASEAPCKIPVKSSSNPTTSKKDIIVQGDNTVVLRRQQGNEAGNELDSVKRMSRLGSFITVDPPLNSDVVAQIPVMSIGNGRTPTASAIVPPFNYNPKPADIPSHIVKAKSDDDDDDDDDGEGKFEVNDSQTEIVTASSRVTTV